MPDNAGLREAAERALWPFGTPIRLSYEDQDKVTRIAALLAERDDLAAKVAAVREIHREDAALGWCVHCGYISDGDEGGVWPCATTRALGDPS